MTAIWRDDADGRILARNELTAALVRRALPAEEKGSSWIK